jgi:hypothetical protein
MKAQCKEQHALERCDPQPEPIFHLNVRNKRCKTRVVPGTSCHPTNRDPNECKASNLIVLTQSQAQQRGLALTSRQRTPGHPEQHRLQSKQQKQDPELQRPELQRKQQRIQVNSTHSSLNSISSSKSRTLQTEAPHWPRCS